MSRKTDGALRKLFPTRNAAMRAMLRTAGKLLDNDASVLIRGESGVGKDVLAEAIHRGSGRGDGPLVKIDFAGIPDDLFESELFGHEKGAFTDARSAKPGRFELAHRGTLLLDEVGALRPPLQVKLLRVLEDRTVTRLGGRRPFRVDVRVISTTNADLDEMLARGQFRDDLFYRLNVVTLVVPPLRERPEDIPLLARRLLRSAAKRYGRPARDFDSESVEILRRYAWPGNVRELRNVVERAAIVETGAVVRAASLPTEALAGPAELVRAAADGDWPLARLEELYIREVLRRTGCNYSRAAEILGINRKTLLEKRRRYGLDEPRGGVAGND